MRSTRSACVVAAAVGAAFFSVVALAGRVELVSRGAFPAPMPSDGNSSDPAVSADGRYMVFASSASTFGVTDTNRTTDLYLLDRTLAQYSLLSRRGTTQGDRPSASPTISADGARIAFISDATTLDPADANGSADLFVLERVAGTLRRITPAAGVEADAVASAPQISADGRYLAFESVASNWVAGDTNGGRDVFVYDLVTNSVERASVGNTPGQQVSSLYFVNAYSLSAGGRCVAFATATALDAADTNFTTDIYVRDLAAGTTVLASRAASGVVGAGESIVPWISPDCSAVAFGTSATNLTADPANYVVGAFEKNLASGAVTRVWPAVGSPAGDLYVDAIRGSRGGGHLALEVYTDPGVAVFFEPSIVVANRADRSLTTSPATITGAVGAIVDGGALVALSTQRAIASSDRNAYQDIALYDVAGGSRIAVTLPPSPVVASTGNGSSGVGENVSPLIAGQFRQQFVSDDGLLAAFSSIATNLIASDDNNAEDVFVADRRTGINQRLTRGFAGGESNGDSLVSDMTGDGRFVVVESCASNLIAGDTGGVCDVFVTDRTVTPIVFERVNVDSAEVPANAAGHFSNGHWASISLDGRYVAFVSSATNLVAGDTNNRADVFLRDRTLGTTVLLSRGVGGVPANNLSQQPRISADGRYVSFRSGASNLAPGISGAHSWLSDTTTFALELISVTSDEVPVSGANRSFISSDGRYVAFLGLDGLVPGDTNGFTDVFVRDRLLGKTTIASLKPDGTPWDSSVFIGGLSSRGLILPFIVDEGDSVGGASYAYDISTGRVDQVFAAPAGFSQSLRPAASANGRYVAVAHNGVLTPSDQNGAIYDIYVASEFTAGIAGGAEGAAPELALAGSAVAFAEMGEAVAVSEKFIVAGAPGANEVYIFARPPGATGTTMRGRVASAKATRDFDLVATIPAPGGGALGDKWGGAVAITPDGSTLVIGAPGVNAGQVAVFQQPAGGWNDGVSAVQTINAPPASGNIVPDDFGTSVSLAVDGRIVIGAPTSDVFGQADAGMVAVYAPLVGGTYANTPTQTFNAPVAQAGAAFGAEVEATPTAFAVGAPLHDDGGNMDEGVVYTYASSGTNVPFTTAAVISPPDGGAFGDKWGTGIGLTGNTLVVGAPGDDTSGPDTGAAFVFESPSGGFGAVTPTVLMPERTTGGEAVGTSIEAAGDYVVVGAPLSDRLGVSDTGTAFVFERPERGWSLSPSHLPDIELRASESQIDQEFGDSVAVTAQGLVIGVPRRDVGVRDDQGEADTFVFDRIIRAGFE